MSSSREPITTQGLASELKLDERMLRIVLDYLATVLPEVISSPRSGAFVLGPIYGNPGFKNFLYFTDAYHSVVSQSEALLRGTQVPGAVARDDVCLQHASAVYNSQTWDRILEILPELRIKIVLDVGSGDAGFLARALTASPDMIGYGIDIQKEVVDRAKTRYRDAQFASRIFLRQADARDVSEVARIMPEGISGVSVAITGITVWHEFLRNGEGSLLALFEEYKNAFPGSYFIVAEYNAFSYSELALLPPALKEAAALYQLVHPLSGQGMPQPPRVWEALLQKSGIKLIKTVPVNPNSTVFVGIL